MKTVWMMSGLPGCGKTTFARKQVDLHGGIVLSRDDVRFALVKESEPYFSKENLVFATWIRKINQMIEGKDYADIYIDATNLNDKSRKKVIERLTKKENYDLIMIIFTTSFETCIERNGYRKGRSKVPMDVIYSMSQSFDIHTDWGKVIYLD